MPQLPADLLFLLDPQQRKALEMSDSTGNVWIHGQDTSKLIQTLIHKLVENLFDGKTTLVTASPEYERLIHYALEQLGLEHLVFALHGSVNNSAIAALQLARKKDTRGLREDLAELALAQYNNWLHELEERYRSMNRTVFGDMSWKMVLDKSTTRSQNAYKSILDASISVNDFSLTQQEYWHIRGRIKTFQRLRVLRTPAFELLDALAPPIFQHPDGQEAKEIVLKRLSDVLVRGKSLLKRIGAIMHQYRRDTTGTDHKVLQRLKHNISRIADTISEGETRFGNGFLMESTFNEITFRIAKNISKKSHELYSARAELRKAFSELLTDFRSFHLYASRQEDEEASDILLEDIATHLDRMTAVIEQWMKDIDVHAMTRKRQLNARNISEDHELGQDLMALEQEIADFVKWVNELGLFERPVEINALSLEKSSEVIRDLIKGSIRIREALPEFEAYYLWRTFWEQMDPHSRSLLESLDIMEDHEQIDSFDAWYFENILDQIPTSELVTSGDYEQEFGRRISDLRTALLDTIKSKFRSKRHDDLKAFKSRHKKLIQGISTANKVVLSEELRVLPSQALAGLFPIVFCNPTHLRDYGYYFDELFAIDESGADCKMYCAQVKRCILFARSAPVYADLEKLQMKTFRLAIAAVQKEQNLQELPATERLNVSKVLASQFTPYLKDLVIYNCKKVQIFSFLGETLNAAILNALDTPHKEVGQNGAVTVAHITEALLDSKKPIVVLTRDDTAGYSYSGSIFWQNSMLRRLDCSGLHVINTWSANWRSAPQDELETIIRGIQSMEAMVQELPGQAAASA